MSIEDRLKFLPPGTQDWILEQRQMREKMYTPDIKETGYWKDIWHEGTTYGEETKHLPDPRQRVRDEPLSDDVKEAICAYLDDPDHMRIAFRGSSRCRCCNPDAPVKESVFVGHEDVSDGVWRWPSGLSHYVREHDVMLDPAFKLYLQRQLKMEWC